MLHQPLSESEQPPQESLSETFECISVASQTEGSPDCFAFVYLRVVDKETGQPCIGVALPRASIQESLNLYSDPGLAACSALEWLCQQPTGFGHRLEICISLFDPLRCSVTVYSAGCSDSSLVLSNEQGRIIDFSRRTQSGLEKKQLREAETFQNSEPIYLDAYDRYLFLSAACSGRGSSNYDGALNSIFDCLREEVGEDPLRLVTLAKNAFWKGRSSSARGHLPVGPILIAAVRACQRPLIPLTSLANLKEFGSAKYAIAFWPAPSDFYSILPLHQNRSVFVWASRGSDGQLPFSEQESELIQEAILEILDRRDHGDNENPRQAGRTVLERVDCPYLLVVQLFDEWQRIKYFRHGWKQPIALQARGDRSSNLQAFDGGGEVTVEKGSRLLFAGTLDYEGQPISLQQLSTVLAGGKASLTYEQLCCHWKTPPNRGCFVKMLSAIQSDSSDANLAGMALVSRRHDTAN